MRFPIRARDGKEFIPASGGAAGGQLFMTYFRRVALQTGVTLNVALAGDGASPAVIFLHGFPESHRTWRELVPRLEDSFYLIMPDQRGFAGSDRPQEVQAYKTDALVEDLFALANVLGVERFALVGHDWGGAIAWSAAVKQPRRLSRLAIINAPHPVIFQKQLIESEDQRLASQYISAFRAPAFEKLVEAHGYEWFFERTFAAHVDLAIIPETEKQQYIAEWSQPGAFTAMLNWYRAARSHSPVSRSDGVLTGLAAAHFPQGEGSDAGDLGAERYCPASLTA